MLFTMKESFIISYMRNYRCILVSCLLTTLLLVIGGAHSITQKIQQKISEKTQIGNDSFRYFKGSYEIETLTMPRRIFNIEVQPNKTSSITLPTPGLVNINNHQRLWKSF